MSCHHRSFRGRPEPHARTHHQPRRANRVRVLRTRHNTSHALLRGRGDQLCVVMSCHHRSFRGRSEPHARTHHQPRRANRVRVFRTRHTSHALLRGCGDQLCVVMSCHHRSFRGRSEPHARTHHPPRRANRIRVLRTRHTSHALLRGCEAHIRIVMSHCQRFFRCRPEPHARTFHPVKKAESGFGDSPFLTGVNAEPSTKGFRHDKRIRHHTASA